MTNAGKRKDTHRTTLRHNAYSRSSNASSQAAAQGTLCSCIGFTARYAPILYHRKKPDRYITTPNLLTKFHRASLLHLATHENYSINND